MRLTQKVHHRLEAALRRGDRAIDATAGNGHDTLKMASLVGREGLVVALDLQKAAIEATRDRLRRAGQESQVRLVCADHAGFLPALETKHEREMSAIVFNLGYLPGSDKGVTTQAEATVEALRSALRLLKVDAPLLVTAYRGHPGGQAEADAVAAWVASLDRDRWSIKRDDPPLTPGLRKPPILWTIRRISFD